MKMRYQPKFKNLTYLLRYCLTLLICIPFFISCNPNEEVGPEKAKKNKVERINISDDAHLQDLLNEQLRNGRSNRIGEDYLEDLNTDGILKITHYEKQYVKYTLMYNSLTSEMGFRNLYIYEKYDEQAEFFVLWYSPSKDWLRSKGTSSWKNFTGSIKGYDLDGNKVSEGEVNNGRLKSMDNGSALRVISDTHPPLPIAPGCYDLVFSTTTGQYFWAKKPCDDPDELDDGGADSGNDGGNTGDDGGSSNGGGTDDGDDWGGGLDDPDQPGPSPIGGGGSGTGNDGEEEGDVGVLPVLIDEAAAELWEEEIDDSQLKLCLSNQLSSLKSISLGIGSFIQEIDNSDFFKWKLEDKTIVDEGSGQITYGYTEINLNKDGATTYFDANKLTQSTDIGIVSIILHESMHAYLHFKYRDQNISKTYIDLFEKHYSEKAEHEQWVHDDFISSMTSTLKSYGDSKGYRYGIDYYRKIAWGGLKDTEIYNNKPEEEKKSIDDAVKIELTGKDSDNVLQTQKGTDGGC